MSKDEVITKYVKGEITIREARILLNKIEGKRLVDLIDNKNQSPSPSPRG